MEIPGVSNTDFLRLACNARRKELGEPELDPIEFYGYLAPKVGLSSPLAPVTILLPPAWETTKRRNQRHKLWGH